MAQHTPGPWRVAPSGFIVADCLGGGPETGRIVAEVDCCKGNPADLPLIAAAPDLLAALEQVTARIEPCSACDGTGLAPRTDDDACAECGGQGEVCEATGVISDLRAALAKARGEG